MDLLDRPLELEAGSCHFSTTLTSSHLLRPPAGCFRLTCWTFFTLPASLPTHALLSSSSVRHLNHAIIRWTEG